MVLAAYLESVGESPGAILAMAVLDHRRAEYQRAVDEFGDKSRPSAIVDEMRTTVILRYMRLLRAGVAWAEAARDAMSLQQFWGPYLPTQTREVVEPLKFKSAEAVKTAASRYRKECDKRLTGEAFVKFRAAHRFLYRSLAEKDPQRSEYWSAIVAEMKEVEDILDSAIAKLLPPAAVAEIEASLSDHDSLSKSGALKLYATLMLPYLRRSEPR